MPRVSVLIPSYNSACFIATAIDSVLGQDGVDLEVLVQDALSHDGTHELLSKYSGDPRVSVVREADDGVSDALNRLVQRCTGDLVVWLNADEFLLPGALRRAAAALQSDTRLDYVTGDPVFVDGDGRLIRRVSRFGLMRTVLRTKGSYPASCTLIARRFVFEKYPFDVGLRLVMDWDWYLRLSMGQLRGAHLPRPFAAYRIHPGQLTHVESQAGRLRRRILLRLQPEHVALRRRHGAGAHAPAIIARGLIGDVVYGAVKLLTGGYRRDRTARKLIGVNLDWTRHSDACTTLLALGAE